MPLGARPTPGKLRRACTVDAFTSRRRPSSSFSRARMLGMQSLGPGEVERECTSSYTPHDPPLPLVVLRAPQTSLSWVSYCRTLLRCRSRSGRATGTRSAQGLRLRSSSFPPRSWIGITCNVRDAALACTSYAGGPLGDDFEGKVFARKVNLWEIVEWLPQRCVRPQRRATVLDVYSVCDGSAHGRRRQRWIMQAVDDKNLSMFSPCDTSTGATLGINLVGNPTGALNISFKWGAECLDTVFVEALSMFQASVTVFWCNATRTYSFHGSRSYHIIGSAQTHYKPYPIPPITGRKRLDRRSD
ncbi:hypothetical protein B0H14DRAFT_2598456 [Mycena olivaceomarginata]|nr:hypothetical protein B0H14DRAFT_2598456 [Mycena olivaceomarginata]